MLDDDTPLLRDGANAPESETATKTTRRKLSASFFFLGLLNNVLYVIILSAALDLVPPDVPKGVILFANIFPALLVKLGWPYFVPGRVRYGRRVLACSLVSFTGIVLVAISTGLSPRLFGIALASFSSGLGEMTYLQRTTVYGDDELARLAVGWFSSGTGAAGLVGAALWWFLRGLGVKKGLGLSSVLPICMLAVYLALLPKSNAFPQQAPRDAAYTFVPSVERDEEDDLVDEHAPVQTSNASQHLPPFASSQAAITKQSLSTQQKMALARPLFLPFMIPLFVVYFAEYTVNTGAAPTLLYPVPDRRNHLVLASIIKRLSDYYPLWQLVYQSTVFLSRSSTVIFRIPPLPARLIPLPSLVQVVVLATAITESTRSIFTSAVGPGYAIGACFLLIALEGLCGGLAYCNVYLRVGLIEEEDEETVSRGEVLARREFRIACVGFADTLGILAASLVSSWLEPTLCSYQVQHGRTLCREVR